MLADRKKREKWCLNPRGNAWSDDKNKFGQRLLEKMGWTSGQGLGVNNQGPTEIVRVKLKDNNKGLGFNDNGEEWLKTTSDYNELLDQLSNTVEEGVEVEVGLTSSLEDRSKKSKARVHYHKFTRGKDLSRYTEKDLASIIGPEVIKSKKVESLMPDYTSNQVNQGSSEEYFKKKRKFEQSNEALDEVPEDLEINKICSEGPHTFEESKKEQKKKKKKSKDVHLENDEITVFSTDEVAFKNFCKKKKKERKHEEMNNSLEKEANIVSNEEHENTEIVSGENIGDNTEVIQKKKRKKHSASSELNLSTCEENHSEAASINYNDKNFKKSSKKRKITKQNEEETENIIEESESAQVNEERLDGETKKHLSKKKRFKSKEKDKETCSILEEDNTTNIENKITKKKKKPLQSDLSSVALSNEEELFSFNKKLNTPKTKKTNNEHEESNCKELNDPVLEKHRKCLTLKSETKERIKIKNNTEENNVESTQETIGGEQVNNNQCASETSSLKKRRKKRTKYLSETTVQINDNDA